MGVGDDVRARAVDGPRLAHRFEEDDLMRGGTELGRVRGLGSAKHGSGHWWLQRLTALGNIMLILWLIFSLLRLPSMDYDVVRAWLSHPLAAVPMALIVLNTFWHFRIGFQVVIEDYIHGGMRVIVLGLLHLWTFAMGAFALYAIFKIAFTGAAHG
jgi:succinate dehydrogenase / fumarate reductase, membrane anchor subunit